MPFQKKAPPAGADENPETRVYEAQRLRQGQGRPVMRTGKIRLRLDEVMKEKGLVNAKGEANLTDLLRGTTITYAAVFQLLRKPERQKAITFETLAQLCEALQCQPGDLLAYDPVGDILEPTLSEAHKATLGEDAIPRW